MRHSIQTDPIMRNRNSNSIKPSNATGASSYKRQELQTGRFGYGPEGLFDNDDGDDHHFYVVGDRVYVDGFKPASVAYFGEVKFASGDWVGVALDEPLGSHDGRVQGFKYFQCPAFHGQFVRPHRVSRMPDSALGWSAPSSRSATPLPTYNNLLRPSSRSPGSGLYYYDDDYREEPVPSVASLEQRLKSIDELNGRTDTIKIAASSSYPTSILKGSTSSPIGARADELRKRIRASSASPARSPSALALDCFRPRRTQLHELNVERDPYDSSRLSSREPTSSRSGLRVDLSKPKKGDQVVARTERGNMTGILRFMGETNFATGEWAGIELDYAAGKNDGSVLGVRYFHCPKGYGLFVPLARVKKYDPKSTDLGFGTMRSTLKSPPPSLSSLYNSRSTTPSYDMGSPSMSYSSSSLPRRDHSSPSSPSYSTTSSYYANGYSSESGKLGTHDNDFFYRDKFYGPSSMRPKFDERDIENEMRKSLSRPKKITNAKVESAKPKAVKYTFISSKHDDGNPIVRRTLVYK